ncbi:MAG: fumarylacetoacetate hydrolase family protein [Rhodospirillales bacterium]|nr:fumarylacetoacetate hydrolase family protein [Rhodospirillales bacterium]
MKFVSYKLKGKDSYGVVVDDGVVDLGKRFGKKYPTLRAAMAAGKLNDLKKAAKGKKPGVKLSKVSLLPVIPDARKIFCVGLNYREHRAETGRPDTAHPSLFTRFADTAVGHEQPILKPKESDKLDWEGELVVIIGRSGRRIPREKAMSYIAGYSIFNDASIRDWQRHTSQWIPGKNWPQTGGFGPWMVTTDELKDITKQTLTTRVNGVVKQQATIDMMIFDIPEQIAYISSFSPLEPGDVIVTGTPGGVGFARTPPEFMKAGDMCEIEITGVGTLRNRIKDS